MNCKLVILLAFVARVHVSNDVVWAITLSAFRDINLLRRLFLISLQIMQYSVVIFPAAKL